LKKFERLLEDLEFEIVFCRGLHEIVKMKEGRFLS